MKWFLLLFLTACVEDAPPGCPVVEFVVHPDYVEPAEAWTLAGCPVTFTAVPDRPRPVTLLFYSERDGQSKAHFEADVGVELTFTSDVEFYLSTNTDGTSTPLSRSASAQSTQMDGRP